MQSNNMHATNHGAVTHTLETKLISYDMDTRCIYKQLNKQPPRSLCLKIDNIPHIHVITNRKVLPEKIIGNIETLLFITLHTIFW